MSITGTDFALLGHEAVQKLVHACSTSSNKTLPIFTHPQIISLLSKPQIVQRSPDWYACRNKVLTASDVGTVIGVNPFSSRRELLEKKLLARIGVSSGGMSKFGMIACEHGEKYEDEAAREYFTCYPENGVLFNFGLIRHPTYEFLAGSPDRVTQNGILIEIKVS